MVEPDSDIYTNKLPLYCCLNAIHAKNYSQIDRDARYDLLPIKRWIDRKTKRDDNN